VSDTRHAVARGTAWQSAAQWSSRLVALAAYAILARILGPRDFGIVALGWVYLSFTQIFVDQGLSAAVIQRQDLEPGHLDSAFWLGLATALLLAGGTVAAAKPIAELFKTPDLAPVVAWLALVLPINALGSVSSAVLSRRLDFRPVALSNVANAAGGAAVGIGAALLGWGVWSLVAQAITGAAFGASWLLIAARWRPRLRVSRRHARDLYGFSLAVAAKDVVWFFAGRSDTGFVGYAFGPVAVGAYSLAGKLSRTLEYATVGAMQAVTLPALSRLQDDLPRFRAAIAEFCRWSCFVGFPLFAGLALVPREAILLAVGPKWLIAAPMLRALSAYCCVLIALGFAYPVLLASGRTGLYLGLEIVLALLTVGGIVLAMRWSPTAVAWSLVATLFTFGALQTVVVARVILRTSLGSFLRPFAYPTICTALMIAASAAVRRSLPADLAAWQTLAAVLAAAAAAYTIAATILDAGFVRRFLGLARYAIGLGPRPAAEASSL